MKAVIYARVSSDKQDVDLSISAQLKQVKDYASRHGYEVVREFIDEAQSGKTSARPAFREMIALARRSSKPFDTVLVWKYSRFARSRSDSIVFKTLLRKSGVQVISISEQTDKTPTGKLLEAIIEDLDEYYSANLGEDVTRGMRESASRGFYVANYPPYGYYKVSVKDGNKEHFKLQPDVARVPVVERLFKEMLEGKGLVEIVKNINKEGIAGPRGKNWVKTTIHKMLTNEAYTGTLVWDKNNRNGLPPIRVENAWPSIVDKDTFTKVQAVLKERAPLVSHPRRTSSPFLLSGIAKCGYCGKALIGNDAKSGKFSYYVCGTLLKKGAKSCQSPYLNSKVFESLVVTKIKHYILTEKNLCDLVRLVNEEMDAASVEWRKQLNTINEEIADVERRLNRLYEVLETGKLRLDDLSDRIHPLKNRRDLLQSQRWELEWQLKDRKVELADNNTIKRYVEDLRNLLTNSKLSEKRAFIRSFVKEVNVEDKKATLTYTIPMPPEGITNEEMPVLPTVHYGGR